MFTLSFMRKTQIDIDTVFFCDCGHSFCVWDLVYVVYIDLELQTPKENRSGLRDGSPVFINIAWWYKRTPITEFFSIHKTI